MKKNYIYKGVVAIVAVLALALTAQAQPLKSVASGDVIVGCGSKGIYSYTQPLAGAPYRNTALTGSWADCDVIGGNIYGVFIIPGNPARGELRTFASGLAGGSSTTPPAVPGQIGSIASDGSRLFWATGTKVAEVLRTGGLGRVNDTGQPVSNIAASTGRYFTVYGNVVTAYSYAGSRLWSQSVDHRPLSVFATDKYVAVQGGTVPRPGGGAIGKTTVLSATDGSWKSSVLSYAQGVAVKGDTLILSEPKYEYGQVTGRYKSYAITNPAVQVGEYEDEKLGLNLALAPSGVIAATNTGMSYVPFSLLMP